MFDRRLRFSNISESDSGEYQCISENSQGKAVHTYTLTVEGISLSVLPSCCHILYCATYRYNVLSPIAAPYWTKEPLSQLYAPGETVRLDCQADGIPNPTINWTINGIPISGQYTHT